MKAFTKALDSNPVATIGGIAIALVGGVIAILHPETLSFNEYCKDIGVATGGIGILGIARSMGGKG